MAHHPRHRISTLIAITAITIGLAACTTENTTAEVDDVAVIITPTTGATALTAADLAPVVSKFDTQGDHLTVIEATSTPTVIADVSLDELDGNSTTREDQLTDFRTRATSAITSRVATTPEIDLAEAIAMAGHSLTGDGNRELIIYGSGLSTTGSMSMLEGRLYADPADLVANAKTSSLPDLTGVTVEMPKFGVVTSPQEALNAGATRALTDIWSTYFAATGTTDVNLDATGKIARANDGTDLPKVTPVPIDRPTPINAGVCRQNLPDASIGFAAGRADLTDPNQARETITDIVKRIGDCDGDYRVEASASSEGGTAANKQLTKQRARTVADILADVSGTPTSSMHLTGWGETWPCRINDIDDNGQLILDAATKNRVVVISKTTDTTSTC